MGINGSKEAHHELFQYNTSNSSPEANELLYNKLITAVFSEVPLGDSDPQTGYNESIHDLLTDNSGINPLGEKEPGIQNDLKTFNYRKLASHIVFLLNDFDYSNLSKLQETYTALSIFKRATIMIVGKKMLPSTHLASTHTVSMDTISEAESTHSLMHTLVRSLASFLIEKNELSSFLKASSTAVGGNENSDVIEVLRMSVNTEIAFVLIALLSTQMYNCDEDLSSTDENSVMILNSIAGTVPEYGKSLAVPLVCSLLRGYVELMHFAVGGSYESSLESGEGDFYAREEAVGEAHQDHSKNIPVWMLSSIASLVTLPIRGVFSIFKWIFVRNYQFFSNENKRNVRSALRDAYLYLLLVLVHPTSPEKNHFREALNTIDDSHYEEEDLVAKNMNTVDFTKLYDCLTKNDEICFSQAFLLYMLIQGNNNFSLYSFARSDCDTLLVPILHLLYDAIDNVDQWGQQQLVHILVIILLILTKDPTFTSNFYSITLDDVWWYKEWHLSKISLDSLLIIIIVRVIQNNLSKLRDPFLHNNCLAILSNCAPYFVGISSYAAMRLVNVVSLITMKCTLLKESEGKMDLKEEDEKDPKEDNDMDREDIDDDLPTTTYSGFLHSILSIISTTLEVSIEKNPHLIYALLQQKNVFKMLSEQEEFAEIGKEFMKIVQFFDKDIESIPESWRTPERVLHIIDSKIHVCKSNLNFKVENVGFMYKEDETAYCFFNPLAWILVFSSNWFGFDVEEISLFPTP